MDRLDAMEVLLAVVDAGSLSAGSRKLNAPLASVSRKVAELERHLGARLLIRTSRNVQLTDAGRDYVDAARQIVGQLKDAELRASGEYDEPRGELTLTVSMEFGRTVALPIAYEFLAEHPQINLNVLSADRVVQMVEERVDVGIRLGPLVDSSLYALKVGNVCLVTCASPDYISRFGQPETPEDLSRHRAAVFGRLNEAPWAYTRDGQKFEGQPLTRVRANTATAAVAAACKGIGVTRVLNFQVDSELRSGALVPVLADYCGGTMAVHLVYLRQGLLPLKVRAFLDWMTPRLRQTLKELAAQIDEKTGEWTAR
jgi:DNA-binding transcriptional LysR family regulator